MPDNMQTAILEKEGSRYKFLLALYQLSSNHDGDWVPRLEIIEHAGLDTRVAAEAEDYLGKKGLIRLMTGGSNGNIEITHNGTVEVEESIKNPNPSPDQFQVPAITQNFNAPIGAVQTGNHNTANVNQKVGGDVSEILNLLHQARKKLSSLPQHEQREAIELTETLEKEIVSGNASRTKLKAYGKALLPFLEKVATSVVIKSIELYIEQL